MPIGMRFVRPWSRTGRMRLRSSWFGMIIVEIEEEQEHCYKASPGAVRVRVGTSRRWRRARRHDIARNVEVVLR